MEPPLLGDVNRDGVVNLSDLAIVGSNFGLTGQNDADVNRDGIVNILDLVTVASALGNAAAAPSLKPQTRAILTAAEGRGLAHPSATNGTDRSCLFARHCYARTTPRRS